MSSNEDKAQKLYSMAEQLQKLYDALAASEQDLRSIQQLILANQITWVAMPGPKGVAAFHGTGGGYTIVLGKANSGILGSYIGQRNQATVLRDKFAQFCFEAAANQTKKN